MAFILPASYAFTPSPVVYSVDAGRSKIELAVFRDGLLKGIGHDHTVAARSFSGEIRFNSMNIEDSSVHLTIESESLVVLDPNVSEKDRQEIQSTMQGAKVLNIKEFPRITFHSTGLSKAARADEDFKLTGRLDLHGVEKEITFPVNIYSENDLLRATGVVSIAQTDFGIKPVKVAFGTVRVKDQIQLKFNILAERK
jgi:polyisoprenoid-binding protein YceI